MFQKKLIAFLIHCKWSIMTHRKMNTSLPIPLPSDLSLLECQNNMSSSLPTTDLTVQSSVEVTKEKVVAAKSSVTNTNKLTSAGWTDSIQAEKENKPKCGDCRYCKGTCSCPACNGYSNWGGCDGCRNN